MVDGGLETALIDGEGLEMFPFRPASDWRNSWSILGKSIPLAREKLVLGANDK